MKTDYIASVELDIMLLNGNVITFEKAKHFKYVKPLGSGDRRYTSF